MAAAQDGYIKPARGCLTSRIAYGQLNGHPPRVGNGTRRRGLRYRIEWSAAATIDYTQRRVIGKGGLTAAVSRKGRNGGRTGKDKGWKILVYLTIAVVVYTVTQLRSAGIDIGIGIVAIVGSEDTVAIQIYTATGCWTSYLHRKCAGGGISTAIISRQGYRQ